MLGNIALNCSANRQPLFQHKKPLVWQFGDDTGTVDLLRTADRNVQLIFTEAPVLRQKVTEKKIGLIKYTQLLDTTDLAVRTVDAQRTNDLAFSYSLLSDDQTFKNILIFRDNLLKGHYCTSPLGLVNWNFIYPW